MVKVKDISEIYLEDRETHLNKDVYVDINGELLLTNWVHHIGDIIVLTTNRR